MSVMEQDESLDGQALRLSEESTIAVSGELYQQLAARLERGGDITLDAGSVRRVDAAVIQLLYQVQRVLTETGSCLKWTAVSPAFSESVSLLGLSGHLQITNTA